jgi:hypothetical protein
MSGNRWDTAGVPHKGWTCVDVVDLRADGGPAGETDYATCQMCGNEKIRYVHIMEHPDLDEHFDVGCVCAEKMSDDYEGPRRREARLRNRAARRTLAATLMAQVRQGEQLPQPRGLQPGGLSNEDKSLGLQDRGSIRSEDIPDGQ